MKGRRKREGEGREKEEIKKEVGERGGMGRWKNTWRRREGEAGKEEEGEEEEGRRRERRRSRRRTGRSNADSKSNSAEGRQSCSVN